MDNKGLLDGRNCEDLLLELLLHLSSIWDGLLGLSASRCWAQMDTLSHSLLHIFLFIKNSAKKLKIQSLNFVKKLQYKIWIYSRVKIIQRFFFSRKFERKKMSEETRGTQSANSLFDFFKIKLSYDTGWMNEWEWITLASS